MQARDRENADVRRTKQAQPPAEATGPSDARVAAALSLQRAAGNAAVSEMLQRRAEEDVAPQAAGEAPTPGAAVRDVLRRPGRPLPPPVQREMEARLGADFSGVRLHNDSAARESAAQVGARAFTSGSHVVLGEGGGDRHTLAHELTHVIQQRRGPVAGTPAGDGLSVSDPSDRFERAAEANADRVMAAPVRRRAEDLPVHGGHDAPHSTLPVQRVEPEGGADTAASATAAEPEPTAATQEDGFRSLRELAKNWKLRSSFSFAIGRSGELLAVDEALADWLRRDAEAPDKRSESEAQLQLVLKRIAAWRGSQRDWSKITMRGVHIDRLERRIYTALNHETPWQMSRNGNMAVPLEGPKREFYATSAIVDAANRTLKAQGAPLQLTMRGRGPRELAKRGLRRVTPVMSVDGRLVRDDELLKVSECVEVAREILGPNNVTHAIFRPAGGPELRHRQDPNRPEGIAGYPHILARPGMTPQRLVQQAQQENNEFFRFTWTNSAGGQVAVEASFDDGDSLPARRLAIPILTGAGMDRAVARRLLTVVEDNNFQFYAELQQQLVDRAQAEGILDSNDADEAEVELAEIAKVLRAPQMSKVPVAGYEDLPDDQRQQRDRRFGINAAASPNVGEAFGIFGTREQTDEERNEAEEQARREQQRAQAEAGEQAEGEQPLEVPDPWTYHFAGVVARDGDDVVTLENYNRRLDADGKLKYYFALYQAGTELSFHGQHRGTVTGALTLVMGAAADGQ